MVTLLSDRGIAKNTLVEVIYYNGHIGLSPGPLGYTWNEFMIPIK